MRATLAPDVVDVAPGTVAAVQVDVANTSEVIDGVGARVIGLDEQYVTANPKLLPLFPDARGTVRLSLAVPAWFPAGVRQVAVEVQSHGALEPSVYLDLNLDVAARPALRVTVAPKIIRTRRSARYVVQLHNDGNVPLGVTLQGVDLDRSCECHFSQDAVRVDAGTTVSLFMTVRCPRMLTGGELDRNLTVRATPEVLDRDADASPTEAEHVSGMHSAPVQVRQRPLIGRGLMTAMILASIVVLWAGAFLLGIAKVFGGDPLTKDAPASFFVKPASGAALAPGGSHEAAPAGAIPKSGQVPPGVGGQITGTVLAVSDNQPVGRILVQAVRISAGKQHIVSSAATQADGTYTLSGLFPVDYYVKFSAPGFKTIWYPSSPTAQHAKSVPAQAQGTTAGINTVITGLPAQISGKVVASGAVTAVATTVVAHPLTGNGKAITAPTGADGTYSLKGLPAPGTYELTYTAAGYQTNAITDTVTGGDNRLEPDVVLGAGAGQITGTVLDSAGHGVGGATVSTTVNGKPLTVITPTTGAVGAYALTNLLTPATYVITFTATGYGSVTQVISLAPGKSASKDVNLTEGTGTVTGTVTTVQGGKQVSLGGVSITVGGATTPTGTAPSTTTLTEGTAIGSFAVNGLTAPGSYTITASLAGYNSATLPFTLSANGTGATVQITLTQSTGTIKGQVSGACTQTDCSGDLVSVTDGANVQTVRVTDTGYLVSGLHPGTYSVTVSDPDGNQKTAMVTVKASTTPTTQDFTLGP
jgi:hypothetical protein